MEMAQSVYAFVKNAGKDVAHVDLVKLHQSQVSDLKEQISMHDMEMQRVKSAHSLELQHAASRSARGWTASRTAFTAWTTGRR